MKKRDFKIKHRYNKQASYKGLACYGNRYTISKWSIRGFNLLMAVLIPIVYPLPLAMALNKFIKRGLVIRY